MHAVPFLNENKSVFSPENKVHGHNGLQVQTEQCQWTALIWEWQQSS